MKAPKRNEKRYLQQDLDHVAPGHAVPDEPELTADEKQVDQKSPRAQRQRAVEAQYIIHARYGRRAQRRAQDQYDPGGKKIETCYEQQVFACERFHAILKKTPQNYEKIASRVPLLLNGPAIVWFVDAPMPAVSSYFRAKLPPERMIRRGAEGGSENRRFRTTMEKRL